MCLFLLFAILLVRTADRKYTGGSAPHERNGFRKCKKEKKKMNIHVAHFDISNECDSSYTSEI